MLDKCYACTNYSVTKCQCLVEYDLAELSPTCFSNFGLECCDGSDTSWVGTIGQGGSYSEVRPVFTENFRAFSDFVGTYMVDQLTKQ